MVIGSLSEKIDRCVIKAPVSLVTNQLSERLGKFKDKRLATWSVEDTQEWLLHTGVKEFYRQSFAELMMDGFLMSSLTDKDLSQFLGVDSQGARRTILHQIVILQEREKKLPDSWHLQAKSARPRTGTVYLIYDPADTNLAKTLSTELQKNKLLVLYSEYSGQSKEEFLRENGPHMSLATKVVLVLTEAAAGSPIVYLQVLFSEWLGKAMITAVFRNSWDRLRPSLQVILGDKSAVDFERQLFQDALPILQDLLRPRRMMPGVILEQAYIDRIAEGVKPLQNLASSSADVVYWPIDNEEIQPKIFISYQWDVQTKESKHVYIHSNEAESIVL
ncbi:uncharacterized protein LOC121313913 [Polyodon spathula]|uniref:uncharacterized protein LOC121313913 n=1 Tax=Polyodon spathula TaxID=7913 RepID=UPI001B7E8484|nr:uncharacterized protein LOC121313913 [Polyodon spathula]